LLFLVTYKKKERCALTVQNVVCSKCVKHLVVHSAKGIHYERHSGCSPNVTCGQGPNQQAIHDLKVLQFQMALGDSMEEHLSKLGAIVKELDAIRATILKEVKIMVLMMSLPQSYEYLVTFLESLEFFNLKKLTWEVVTTRLLNEKLMRKEKNKSLKIVFVKTTLLFEKSSTQRCKDKSERALGKIM